MATHLPPEDIIAEYAAGVASPGVSLLVAAHATQVPETRALIEKLEDVGGAMLLDEPEMEMGEGALDAVLARINGQEAPAAASPRGACPIPAVILEHLGLEFDVIPWRFVLPGVSGYEASGFVDENVSLLRARPGAKIPQHTHEGAEMTLVLQGCLSDGGVVYLKGDVAINDEDDDHRPEVLGDEMCYCLIVRHGDLRFTGRLSRFLNYIGE